MLDTFPFPLGLIGAAIHSAQWTLGTMFTADSALDGSIGTTSYFANLDIMPVIWTCTSIIWAIWSLAPSSSEQLWVFG